MDDLEVKQILLPDTGKSRNIYKYKGKKCYRVPLRSKMAEQLAGYIAIENDLKSSLTWLKHIQQILENENSKSSAHHLSGDREKFDIIKGLFVASLTFYAKSFTKCEDRKIQLNPKTLDAKFRDDHRIAMNFRHNFAAHSGNEIYENTTTYLVFDSSRKPRANPQIICEMSQPDSFNKDGINEFIDLVEHVVEKVTMKQRVIRDKILKEDVFPKGKEYWRKLGKKHA